MNPRAWLLGLMPALALGLAGCYSIVPQELADTVNRNVSGADLIREPERYLGDTVVVGGVILMVWNRPGQSELEILERPLEREEPAITDHSAGRFLIHSREFLDPAVFAVGRRVTVVGTVGTDVERKIGDVDYRYPVVESRVLKLWPLETAPRYYGYPPYWYDPFWGPYWYRDPFFGPYWRYRFRR